MNAELQSTISRLATTTTFHTSDLEAARQYVSSLYVPHRRELSDDADSYDFSANYARIEGVSLLYTRHGTAFRVCPTQVNDFVLLQIPICGESFITHQGRERSVAQRIVALSPGVGVEQLRFGKGSCYLSVRIERSDLERRLESLLRRSIDAPIQFATTSPLSDAGVDEIVAVLNLITVGLNNRTGLLHSPSARRQLVALLISTVLINLDHNYRTEVTLGDSAAKPAYVRDSQQYLRQNMRRAVTPEEVASAAHVSVRTLHAGFKKHLNTTPLRYLKQLRLDLVRRELMRSDIDSASITSIALVLGFEHLGRFCADYKERFGELPRETLRKTLGRS